MNFLYCEKCLGFDELNRVIYKPNFTKDNKLYYNHFIKCINCGEILDIEKHLNKKLGVRFYDYYC